jgi:hypothetical protein
MQQEILKIYEDGVLNSGIEIDDEYLKISKTAQPSSSDLKDINFGWNRNINRLIQDKLFH